MYVFLKLFQSIRKHLVIIIIIIIIITIIITIILNEGKENFLRTKNN